MSENLGLKQPKSDSFIYRRKRFRKPWVQRCRIRILFGEGLGNAAELSDNLVDFVKDFDNLGWICKDSDNLVPSGEVSDNLVPSDKVSDNLGRCRDGSVRLTKVRLGELRLVQPNHG